MVANEKGVVRRDDIRIEDREWRFQLRRSARQAYHRTLLRILDERPCPVLERQRCRGRKCTQRGGCHSGTERRNGRPGMFYEAPSVDHRISSFLIGRRPRRSGAAWKLQPSAPRSSLPKESREPAADTCVQADIFSGDILASLTCRRLFRLRLGENFHESGEKHFPFFGGERLPAGRRGVVLHKFFV